jgi:hypothetical protein
MAVNRKISRPGANGQLEEAAAQLLRLKFLTKK